MATVLEQSKELLDLIDGCAKRHNWDAYQVATMVGFIQSAILEKRLANELNDELAQADKRDAEYRKTWRGLND